jgi:Do/DeqQ family serine protease
MLKQVNPAVVNISTYSIQQTYNPLLNDPFFRYFFNIPDQQQFRQQPKKRQQSAGSGVIVDASKGTVITNYHVIKGADEVHVSLTDGRDFEAKLVGADAELDVAVLNIDAKSLADVKLADSSQLEVGDFVIAIGNPFGLGQTVTTGIVSALGRTGLGIEGYENFIQTDASINPGNSGGALVNLRGELVGMNTAIIAPSGGNVGIGFAIPINMVKSSVEQILAQGEVRRGTIGVSLQDITSELRSAFNLKNGQRGVLITGVTKGSSAESAGIRTGDVIIAVDGEKITSTGQLKSQIGIKSIGKKVTLTIIRSGKQKELQVKITKPKEIVAETGRLHPLLEGAKFKNNSTNEGVVVVGLVPNSSASYSGLRVGDIIVGTNRMRIYNIDSFKKALRRDRHSILLHINRGGGSLFIVLR